jgi:uncharacterized protein YkwD
VLSRHDRLDKVIVAGCVLRSSTSGGPAACDRANRRFLLANRSTGFWGGLLLSVFAAGLWTGCQDDDIFSFAKAGVGLDKAASSKNSTADSCEDVADSQAVIQAVLAAVNGERARHDLAPLRLDPSLCDVAGFFACRLVEGGFFAHEDPFDESTVDVRAANFGYAFQKIGENLAAGQRSVDEAMADWMASAEHRSNMLDPAYMDVGIGVKLGGECGIYWVLELGRPISAADWASPKAAADREHPAAVEQGSTSKPADQPTSATSQSESRRG